MAVNLKGIELSGGAPLGLNRKQGSPVAASAESQDSSPQAGNVSITSTAEVLAQVQQNLSAQSPINQSRVDAISRAIASGSYRIDPDRIAGGLIQSERDLARLGTK